MSTTRVRRRVIRIASRLPGWPRVPLFLGVLLLGAVAVLGAVWFPTAGPSAAAPASFSHPSVPAPHSRPILPAAATVPAVSTPSPAVIRLHRGDTLWALAQRYRTTVAALQQANGLGDSTRIYAGTGFRVPAATIAPHRVAVPQRESAETTSVAVDRPSAGSVQQAAAATFGPQYACAASIITRESGWNVHASNPASGAYGLAQALPGSKMAAAGPDWRSNPATQLAWMRDYVTARYGGACGAWTFWRAHHWY